MLRSIRYGEADRILHLYTPRHGRVGAIAKGARRARSRFGARLEPFMQIAADAARGAWRAPHGHRRRHGRCAARASGTAPRALDAAARACDAVARLFETDDPHPEVYALLANQLTLLAASRRRAGARERAGVPPQAAARGRHRASARLVRQLRRARAPDRLLGGRRRGGLQLLRVGGVPARRGSLRVHGRRRSAARSRARPQHRSARCGWPSARSARPPSITPTCACGRSRRGLRTPLDTGPASLVSESVM